MRLAALDLTAFGRFADRRLLFPAQVAADGTARPGFHVIHGRNEAGKSTLLAALSGLLFGIPERSPYGFLSHSIPLTVGGVLEAPDGGRLALTRLKRRRAPLLDDTGAPLPEERLAAFTGRVSRDFFERVFRLDHARMTQAEQDLLADGGDLGISLFQAGMGIGQVRRLIAGFDMAAAARFKPRAQNPTVNVALRALSAARQRERDGLLRLDTWRRLEADCAAARMARDAARDALAAARTRRGGLDRIGRTLVPLAACARLQAALDGPLAAVPDLPGDSRDRLDRLIRDRDKAVNLADQARQQIDDQEAALAELPAAPLLLAAAGEITDLTAMRGAIAKGAAEIPKRQHRIAGTLATLRQTTAEIDLAVAVAADVDDTPAPALPAPHLVKQVQRQATAHGELRAERGTARRSLDAARETLHRLRTERDGLPPAVETEALRQVVRGAGRRGDLDQAVDRARGEAEAARTERDRRLATLPLFSGDPAGLDRLPVPLPETRHRIAAAWVGLTRQADGLGHRVTTDRAALADLRRKLAGLEAGGAVPSEAALSAARQRRDAALARVRAQLDGAGSLRDDIDLEPPIDGATRLTGEADRLADALRADADRVAGHAALASNIDSAAARLAEGEAALAAVDAARRALAAEWVDAWRGCGFAPLPPAEMEPWLEQRDAALAAQRAMATADATLAAAKTERDDRRAALLTALADLRAVFQAADANSAAIGDVDGLGFADLMDGAAAAVDKLDRQASRRDTLSEDLARQRSVVAAAERMLADFDRDQADWQRDWEAALAAAGLPAGDDPRVAADKLDRLAELRDGVTRLGEDRDQLAGLQADRAAFDRRVADLAGQLLSGAEGDAATGDSIALSRALDRALQTARQNEDRRGALTKALATWRDKRQAAEQNSRRADKALRALYDSAGVADDTALRLAIDAARDKRTAIKERDTHRATLAADWPDQEPAAITAVCAGQDPDALAVATAALDAELPVLEAADQEARTRLAALAAQLNQIGGGDAAIDGAEAIEATAAHLRAEVEAFARPAIAAALLRRAIVRYRERNEGPVLADAKVLFADLTDGAFAGLEIDVDRQDQPRLIGLRNPDRLDPRDDGTAAAADGGRLPAGMPRRVTVADMSDGTRDQLYLALRLAVMHDHARRVGPLPFIADDLLIQFDDPRARATLRVLDRMADRFQVLFLTHHDAMRDLARAEISAPRLGIVALSQ